MIGADCDFQPGVVAIITGDLVRYGQAIRSIDNVVVPAGSNEHWEMGSNVAGSLNKAIALMVSRPEFQWIWLMGDDHVFPQDIVLKLLARGVDCIVPLCLNRFPPFDPTIIKGDGANRAIRRLESLPDGGLYELADDETCGDAGMLLSRRVIEALEPPWYNRTRSGSVGVDDQVFVQRVKEAGFKVHVDLDNVIGHMSPFVMLPYRKPEGWQVRLLCGSRHAADLIPQRVEP